MHALRHSITSGAYPWRHLWRGTVGRRSCGTVCLQGPTLRAYRVHALRHTIPSGAYPWRHLWRGTVGRKYCGTVYSNTPFPANLGGSACSSEIVQAISAVLHFGDRSGMIRRADCRYWLHFYRIACSGLFHKAFYTKFVVCSL